MKPTPTPDFVVVITPAGRSRFACSLDGEDIGTTDTPLYDAARVLMDRGHDPNAIVATRHAGSATIAMFGRIGRLSGLTVSEPASGGIRVVRHRPMPASFATPAP